MPGLLPDTDPDGLLEYSVVYTDRSLNHMSQKFQQVMRDISGVLKTVYHARSAIVVPGSGTFGMEAVARQFATGRKALVIRNGWFSYRWTQIFEMGQIPSEHSVLKARPVGPGRQAAFAPAPIDEVVAAIRAQRPAMVFAPHVETAAGMLLPDAYLRAVADAAHEVGGLFVLDCIASGALWVDMQATGVDVLVSAPQKGWSGSPCCAFVMLERARAHGDRRHHQHQLRGRPEEVAADHGDLRRRRPRLPRDAADRCADAHSRRDAGDASLRLRQAARRADRPRPPGPRLAHRQGSAQRGCRGLPGARASSSATPTTTACTPARPSSPRACRRHRACRCSATRGPTSRPSASGCSGSTSCTTRNARWPTSRRR